MVPFFVTCAVFFLVFTAWGWRWVIIPVGVPLLSLFFRVLRFVIWFGFFWGVLDSTFSYRLFGTGPTIALSHIVLGKSGQQLRWEMENASAPDGRPAPNWRVKRHLRPLPKDWDGEGEHILPSGSLWVLLGGILALWIRSVVRRRRRREMERPVEMPTPSPSPEPARAPRWREPTAGPVATWSSRARDSIIDAEFTAVTPDRATGWRR
jgi:hypothetical protein